MVIDSGDIELAAGSDISNASGSLTIDVADNLSLDVDGGNIALKDGGTQWGNLANNAGDFEIDSNVQDKDIKFKGNDGGSTITALTLDMSDAGAAIFNSKVGIGTAPGTILHTRTQESTANHNAGGGFYHTSSSTAANRRAQLFLDADKGDFSTSSDGAYAYLEKHGNGGILNIINQDAADTAFQQGGSEKMRITSAGRVGLGTTSPSERLELGDGSSTNRLKIDSPTKAHYIGYDGSDDALQIAAQSFIKFQSGGSFSEAMRIDSSGRLGLNTTSPTATYKLSIASAANHGAFI